MAEWTLPRFNLSAQLPALLTLLESELPAMLADDERDLPDVNDNGWRIGEPTMIGDDEWPCCTAA